MFSIDRTRTCAIFFSTILVISMVSAGFAPGAKGSTAPNNNVQLSNNNQISGETYAQTEDINAEIVDITHDSGIHREGDPVRVTVTVENTGSESNRFYIGFSVRNPNGKWLDGDNEASLYLRPGERATTDLIWYVDEGAESGLYDSRVSAWEESNPDNLQNRAADDEKSDAFKVEPETEEYRLNADTNGEGGFEVDPPGFSTTSVDREYEEGTEVEITATPGSDSQFVEWSGDIGSADEDDQTIEVTMDEARDITAEFEEQTEEYRLNADTDGEGGFEVDPPGFSTTSIDREYEEGTEVELTAISGSDSQFVEWSGDIGSADEDDQTIEVTMDEARDITAEFEEQTEEYRLNVDTDGEGGLEVDPPGFSTTSTDREYEEGTEVELTAISGSDSQFVEWSGDIGSADEDDQTIEVTMDEARDITAEFEKQPGEYDLTATTSGNGKLKISPPSIFKENVDRSYVVGTTVTLTAESGDGAQFTGWEGDVSDSNPQDHTIEVTMDQARSLTATFSPTKQYELSVDSDGGGTVQIIPPNVRRDDFAQLYPVDTDITLRANPNTGYSFSGWKGDISNIDTGDRSVELAMDGNRDLTATFERQTTTSELTVRVESPTGTVPAEATVGIQNQEGTETKLGSDGTVVYDDLESGEYTVYLQSATRNDVLAVRSVNLDPTSSGSTVTFRSAGERSVDIYIDDTSVEEEQTSEQIENRYTVEIPELNEKVTGDADEGITVNDLPPGDYRVIYNTAPTGYEYYEQEATIHVEETDHSVTISFNGTEIAKEGLDEIYADQVDSWQDFAVGLACGEYCFEGERVNDDYLTGWILSGVLVFGDIRDLTKYVIDKKGAEVGITIIGLAPAAGDTVKSSKVVAKASKYMAKTRLTTVIAKFSAFERQFIGMLDEIYNGAATRLVDSGFDRPYLTKLARAGSDIGFIERNLNDVKNANQAGAAEGELTEAIAHASVMQSKYGDDVRIVDNVKVKSSTGWEQGEIDHVAIKDGKVIGAWETKKGASSSKQASRELRQAMSYIERHDADAVTLKSADNLDASQFKHGDAIDEGTIGPAGSEGYDETIPLSDSELEDATKSIRDSD